MILRQIVIGFLLTGFLLVPSISYAEMSPNEENYRRLLIQLIESLQQQIKLLQSEAVITSTQTISGASDFESLVEVEYRYKISESTDVLKIKNTSHSKYFEQLFKIFPEAYDSKVKELIIFSETSSDYDAFVQTLPPQHNNWLFAVNEINLPDYLEETNAELIVHELAHIVSYDEAIKFSTNNTSKCEPYFENHGCPSSNSYLRQYVDYFWSKANLERADELTTSEDLFSEVEDYYKKNQDNYVTDYAATSPEEDFAETFMFFVLDKVLEEGTLAAEKINWFSRNSFFLDLKTEINQNI